MSSRISLPHRDANTKHLKREVSFLKLNYALPLSLFVQLVKDNPKLISTRKLNIFISMLRVILTLFWCCLAKLNDWLKNFAPLFQPIKRKEAYEWLVCMRLTKLVVRGMFYLMVCVCYEWQRNVMTPNWKPLNVDMTKCLLSFRMYSIKSTVRFEGTLSTHLLLNSPTKSCSPMRAMTTRKKRNKTSTSLRSLRDRSNVFTIARRPKRKERLQKKMFFHFTDHCSIYKWEFVRPKLQV